MYITTRMVALMLLAQYEKLRIGDFLDPDMAEVRGSAGITSLGDVLRALECFAVVMGVLRSAQMAASVRGFRAEVDSLCRAWRVTAVVAYVRRVLGLMAEHAGKQCLDPAVGPPLMDGFKAACGDWRERVSREEADARLLSGRVLRAPAPSASAAGAGTKMASGAGAGTKSRSSTGPPLPPMDGPDYGMCRYAYAGLDCDKLAAGLTCPFTH
jgi:hypothetical protein